MAAVTLTTARARWARIERTVTLLFFVVAGSGMIADLSYLIVEMVRRSGQIDGLQLLTSSVGDVGRQRAHVLAPVLAA
jgi:hypothetical protein